MYDIDYISKLSQILGVVISVVGLFGIYIQLKKQKETTLSQFIIQLNNSFVENDGLKLIYNKLRDPDTHGCLTVKDRDFIVDYLTFFETLFILYEKGTIDIKTMNDMFAFRFFKAVNNKLIQDIELDENGAFYTSIYKLYEIWEKFRVSRNLEIVDTENSIVLFAKSRNFY